ncbi:PREDICTED: interleukin-18 receptor accessory protein isoform X2 [Chinchilla lanigera]|uniref:Interleukin-18 receptor accessory protein n=1 Tax=Chinchilla lanigera TaxID=34839 RepID=A0A8C2V0G4_CHILA|nr:PREDICTED: interleukin-18 receptor accessory protein isoform X2 [Chinchilla lanigera]
MLPWGWLFLWLLGTQRIAGLSTAECPTKNLLWTYSPGREEEFVLFCDVLEPQRPRFSHGSQHSPTQVPGALPCSGSEDLSGVQWYLQRGDTGPLEEIAGGHPHITQIKSVLHFSAPEMAEAGTYVCRARIRRAPDVDVAYCLKTVLEVRPHTVAPCNASAPHKQYLLLGTVGAIHCPGLSCREDAHRAEVTWYQNGRVLSGEKSDSILVDDIYDYHQGTYVCDYALSPNASSWTARAVVKVRTIVADTKFKPDIVYPTKDVLEVELGRPLTLPCTVRFGFQRNFNPVIRWYIRDADQEWEFPVFQEKSVKSTFEEEVIERVIFLKEVTQSDLRRKFVCFAQNSIGNTTQTIQLKEKRGVVFLYVLLGTASTLVGVLAAGVLVYTYWIEILLLCRTYWSKDETLGDKKEFDAFVSYARRSALSSEDPSPLSEEHLALSLFPEILENKYGFTLCLLERDVAPGGVYAEDIVNIIKKSRRGIFILSPNYINGPQVFELQAAVNLALNNQMLKLILIKFCSFREPESLPHLVKKALRVLPTVTWRGLKSVPPNSRFWTQVRCHMPVKHSRWCAWSQLRAVPRAFSPERTGWVGNRWDAVTV